MGLLLGRLDDVSLTTSLFVRSELANIWGFDDCGRAMTYASVIRAFFSDDFCNLWNNVVVVASGNSLSFWTGNI